MFSFHDIVASFGGLQVLATNYLRIVLSHQFSISKLVFESKLADLAFVDIDSGLISSTVVCDNDQIPAY